MAICLIGLGSENVLKMFIIREGIEPTINLFYSKSPYGASRCDLNLNNLENHNIYYNNVFKKNANLINF